MDVITVPLISLLIKLVDLYIWGVIVGVILSLLMSFEVINPYNRFVSVVSGFLNRITDPVLNPIRNFLPDLGGIDVSPILLILGLHFIQDMLRRIALHMVPSVLPL